MQTTISTKFQVVIPKPARERLKLKPKQKLTVIEKDGMLILIPQTTIESLRGIAAGASPSCASPSSSPSCRTKLSLCNPGINIPKKGVFRP
ncbi:hypothetical protein DSCO28_22980 [Desulfosarcina ovata subsp. sediminis]|uniref:SpoVT-AbrB domain-containing protein n=1 Tax=Desulfosarcina ovata subsp. sediminis TaxID=885957 RepID=A0A5K7ZHZ5_9BACT|nr:AbrB/MazE/SpoVT family DNA-binding domain-containing protein [Desulfosarcina ovata]BBO81732.1 hypothetical protein DSCO28_22980 [Desulfosarcina ovata subsp. sediminis]